MWFFSSNLELVSNQNGSVCFTGFGYLGLSGCCSGVYVLESEIAASGWVLYYYPGQGGQRWYYSGGTYIANSSPFNGKATVTQVCINSFFIDYC
jgi:hypothetical protein